MHSLSNALLKYFSEFKITFLINNSGFFQKFSSLLAMWIKHCDFSLPVAVNDIQELDFPRGSGYRHQGDRKKACLRQTTLVTTTETERMAQHKSIHYSSVDTPGKKVCEQFSGFTNQVWLCQGLANIPKVKCLNSDLLSLWSAETFPMAQVSLLHVPLPPPSHPTAGQGSVPDLECIVLVALEPIWQGQWQVGVLLQSSDLNLLLQPPGRAEFNEQIWLHCWKLWP